MNIDTELRDLADLLQKLEQSCTDLARFADDMTPGQFRTVLLGIGAAMEKYREFIAVILTASETPEP